MGIGAITLLVPDYAAGLDLFVGVMGFDVLQDIDEGRKRWITVAPWGGGPGLVIARADTDAQRAAIGRQAGDRMFLFLETADIDADRTRMERGGVHFEEPTRTEDYGRVAVWRDPFGNRWDLLQRA